MPTERALVVAAFDGARWPSGQATLQDAWLGIYQVLYWYDHGLLHVHDAPALWENKSWRTRAQMAEQYIATRLGVAPGDVPPLVDRMMQLPRWQGKQRNNPLGHGLRMLVCEILRRWGDQRFVYNEETKATTWFPGIQMHGRSATPSIDVAVTRNGVPQAIGSCKWSIRHDRISDPTNECTAYKSAAVQRQIMRLHYLVVTNEIDAQRLDKVLNQPCVDAVVHVHLPLVEHLLGGLPTPLAQARTAGRLLDLTQLVQQTHTWP